MVDLDLDGAWETVRRHLAPTPVVRSPHFGALLKLECLQRTGAYKVRGALAALTAGLRRGDTRPVVAASAGNHAAGLAWAARTLGMSAITVIPENAPQAKVERTRSLGAHVLRAGSCYEESEQTARRLAEREGWRFLHAFDDPDVIAGQSTVGRELLDTGADVVVVPVGGGGLASGVALALAGTGTRVYGVRVRASERMTSVADGVRVRDLGRRNRAILADYLSGWVEVSDAEVRRAMVQLYAEEGWVVEGAGAVAVAGLEHVPGQRRVAVVTGGNLDRSAAPMFRAERPVAALR